MSSKAPAPKQTDPSKKDAAEQKTAEAAGSKEKATPQLGALEEDDEFEEFVAEEWNENGDDNEQHLWEDNWDDDDVEDDFSKQLRAELSRAQPMKM